MNNQLENELKEAWDLLVEGANIVSMMDTDFSKSFEKKFDKIPTIKSDKIKLKRIKELLSRLCFYLIDEVYDEYTHKVDKFMNKKNESMDAEQAVQELLEEETELTLGEAQRILDEYYYIDAEDVREMEIYTMYNTYKGYGDGYTMLIKDTDFHDFVKETCREFTQCLPDSFEDYFDYEALYKEIMGIGIRGSADKVALQQAQEFIENSGRDVCLVKPEWEYPEGNYLKIELD